MQSKANDNGGGQGREAGDTEREGWPQQVPAVSGVQGAKRAAGAGQRGIKGLALALLAVAEAALHKGNRRRMEAAKRGGVHQLRHQQQPENLGK